MIKKTIKKIKQILQIKKAKKIWKKNNSDNFVKFGEISKLFFYNDVINHKYIVGKNTYGTLNIRTSGTENSKLVIGNNCSISGSTIFLLDGMHKYNSITMYPYYEKFFNNNIVEAYSKGSIIVDDEVWIGDDVFILSGVHIGKGAIIGARSVVTNNVQPYSIVAGNPAKIIKYRFSKPIIEKLMKIDLTNLEINEFNIDLLYEDLNEDNIDDIIDKLMESETK